MNNTVLETIKELENENIVNEKPNTTLEETTYVETAIVNKNMEKNENMTDNIDKIDNSSVSIKILTKEPDNTTSLEHTQSPVEHIKSEMNNIKEQVTNTINENVKTMTDELSNVVVDSVKDVIETVIDDVINPIVNETPEQRKNHIRRIFTCITNGFKSLSNLMCVKCKSTNLTTPITSLPQTTLTTPQTTLTTPQTKLQQENNIDIINLKIGEVAEFLKQNAGKVSEIRIIMNIL